MIHYGMETALQWEIVMGRLHGARNPAPFVCASMWCAAELLAVPAAPRRARPLQPLPARPLPQRARSRTWQCDEALFMVYFLLFLI